MFCILIWILVERIDPFSSGLINADVETEGSPGKDPMEIAVGRLLGDTGGVGKYCGKGRNVG